jgi:phosphoglycerate dehydrogenase-like enzyme
MRAHQLVSSSPGFFPWYTLEPLPKDSPLWNEPNLYLTPHVSGYSISKEIFRIFAENYRRFVSGEQLMYLVYFSRGY